MISSAFYPHIKGCRDCALCEGAVPETKLTPALFYGDADATTLVVGQQNFGDVDVSSKFGEILSSVVTSTVNPEWMTAAATLQFMTTPTYAKLSLIFGTDWIVKDFMYMDTLRCAFEETNDDAFVNCMAWSSQITLPKVVVLFGKPAMQQFCSSLKKPELEPWKPVKFTRERRHSTIIALPSIGALKADHIERAIIAYAEMKEGF